MMSACPIWSRGLPVRLAGGVVRMCGLIGNVGRFHQRHTTNTELFK
jgi:hypothetical protein